MSGTRYGKNVLVLPEDDANRQIVAGFLLTPLLKTRHIKLLPVAGGWPAVRDSFQKTYNAALARNPDNVMVLLVDFDGQVNRVEEVTSEVSAAVRDRVFVLGAYGKPEELRRDLGSYETIGRAIGRDCDEGTMTTWEHKLLKHNQDELARLAARVKPILF